MLSLAELRRASRVLDAGIRGHRLQGVVQSDERTLVLTIYGGGEGSGGRRHVLLSCRAESARVAVVARPPRATPRPPALVQYLRAHLIGSTVRGVRLRDEDRQLCIALRGREGGFELLLQIVGPRSNLYLLDAEERIVLSVRPLEETRPELVRGEPWRPLATRPPGEGADRFDAESDEGLLEAIEAAYASVERDGELGAMRRRVENALRKEQRSFERRRVKLERELEGARSAARFEREGELLKGVLGRVKRGDREVVARDHATGEEVTIGLDPTLSPAQNMERLFKRYRKAVRALTKAGAREDAVREATAELEALRVAFEVVAVGDDLDALRAFVEREDVARLLMKYAPQAPPRSRASAPTTRKLGKHEVPVRLAPRRYRTAAELEIWVGRSDAGNDHLSTRLARGKDLFFHLDGAPGSHVILRTGGRADPPSEAILDACELAVHFSKFKNATRADVHVVPIKNVKKPKGAKPGLVMVHGGRTVHLRRIPARLERILAARIEEVQ